MEKGNTGSITVGICGAGTMGAKAAVALVEAGFVVRAYDVSVDVLERLSARGVTTETSVGNLGANCDAVFLFLPGPKQIEPALAGKNGLLSAGGRLKVVVDLSTVDPVFTRRMHAVAGDRGVGYLDAPVLGRPGSVGKWVLPVGGDEASLQLVHDALNALAATVVRVGESGSGNQIKLLNQLMFGAINAVTAEVMAVADRLGVSQELFYRTIAGSSAATVSPLFKELGRRIVEDSYEDPTFTVDLLIKDVSLGLAMATEGGADPPISKAVVSFNQRAAEDGFGSADTSIMWKSLQRAWSPNQ
jgi:3-hydroxyisobutyrate dehydrogenase